MDYLPMNIIYIFLIFLLTSEPESASLLSFVFKAEGHRHEGGALKTQLIWDHLVSKEIRHPQEEVQGTRFLNLSFCTTRPMGQVGVWSTMALWLCGWWWRRRQRQRQREVGVWSTVKEEKLIMWGMKKEKLIKI